MQPEEKEITVRGRTVHYFQGGQGHPLVFLHGAGGQRGWQPFLDRLAEKNTVYAPSHPGVARSTGLDTIDSVEDMAFHYLDVFDALGLDRTALIGHSLGGWVAAELAVRCSHSLSHLVLVDAAGLLLPEHPLPDMFLLSPRRLRAAAFHNGDSDLAREYIPDKHPTQEALAESLKAQAVLAKLGWNPYLSHPKLRERLHRVKAPSLVIWGARDELISLPYGEAYRQGLPNARLAVFEDAGHLPQAEQAERFAVVVGEFLGD